jgi:hypothetical protein
MDARNLLSSNNLNAVNVGGFIDVIPEHTGLKGSKIRPKSVNFNRARSSS